MLDEYIKKYTKAVIQTSTLNLEGFVTASDNQLFPDLIGKSITEIHPFFESLLALLSNDSSEDYLFSCIHIDSAGKTMTCDIILQTFEDGKSPLLIIHDLSTHYSAIHDTAQVRNESVIQSEILELKNNALKEKEHFKNNFIANFSHELRDPLTGIITFADILQKTNLNPKQSEYLDVLQSSSNFLQHMIDDILELSKIEAGKLNLNIAPFDLLNFIEDLKRTYMVKAEQKGLIFYSDFSANLPQIIEGDELRLRQALANLLNNAIKFTDVGGYVTFNVSLNQIRAQKASIHFEITDTGIGMAQGSLSRIFNSFTQLNDQDSYKGSGLGLSIAKHLIGLHKAEINVNSAPSQGSTFSTNISFNCKPNLKLVKSDTAVPAVEFNSSKKYNILLVEDSEITQLSILKILATKGQFFLDFATQPEDVIAKVTNYDHEVDLVLMDIKLKDHGGDDIAKLIRKLPEKQHRKTPIIALTAKVFKEDLKHYKKIGINDVIKKPFDEATLINTMAKHLK